MKDPQAFRIRDWMSGRWWLALALAVFLIALGRMGTVGAPAQASMRKGAYPDEQAATTIEQQLPRFRAQIELEERLQTLGIELQSARAALDVERERSSLLEDSYATLDQQFEEMSELVRAAGVLPGPDQMAPSTPMPVEAIYLVDESGPSAPRSAELRSGSN